MFSIVPAVDVGSTLSPFLLPYLDMALRRRLMNRCEFTPLRLLWVFTRTRWNPSNPNPSTIYCPFLFASLSDIWQLAQ